MVRQIHGYGAAPFSFQKSDFQSKLLDLHNDPVVAPSVKLLIIKILDQSVFFPSGLLWFTGKSGRSLARKA